MAKLLAELDQSKYKNYNETQVVKIEKELQQIVRNQNREDQPFTSFIPYPSYDDPQFYNQIFNKREFQKNRYEEHDSSKSYDEVVNERCNPSSFRLTPNQQFLKNFLSPDTPYNGILLFHSVGTGKTCSAISIAEQFRTVFKKRVLVLMPTNLKENFKRQIFDINKVDQCTSRKYLEQVQHRSRLKPSEVEKRVNKIINDNYQFMGFQEFANYVNRMKDNVRRIYMPHAPAPEQGKKRKSPTKVPVARKEQLENLVAAKSAAAIREAFSNRVIIIDEVHNVRSANDETQKIVPPVLLEVLQLCYNVKLVLLTATPMFNNAKEIIWLLNLLLTNDKRPIIDREQLFDADDMLTPIGKQRLQEIMRGYVSYMRGENPFSFPLRLYPSVNKETKILKGDLVPKKDIKGKTIPKEKRLALLEIIGSDMGPFQQRLYQASERTVITLDETDDDSIDEEETTKGSIIQQLVQVSNIVYPANKPETELPQFYGKAGFDNCFDKVQGSKSFRVNYKKEILAKHGEFLAPDTLAAYSPKIKAITDYIAKSQGIVYVFSYFIWSGLVPIAIALEHMGLTKYGDHSILAKRPSTQFKTESGKQACYAILAKDKMLSPNFEEEIERIRAEANRNGEEIKVVLGSNVSAEGIDFKCIREIHLLEPWYHLNKVEQIVGRAIRTCSHVSLDPSKRNVTIYHHASTIPRDKETIDLRIYRIAENKQAAIDAVERLMRQYAIDCNLNKHALYFDPKVINKQMPMLTSQGTKFTHALGDSSGKYKEPVACAADMEAVLDNSTFLPKFYSDDIELYSTMIKTLFQSDTILTFDQILSTLQSNYKSIDDEIVKGTLEYMMRTKFKVTNPEGVIGYIIYRGEKYLFQPGNISDLRITKNRRAKPNLVVKRVRFDMANDQTHTSNEDETVDSDSSMIDTVNEKFAQVFKTDLKISDESSKRVANAIYDYIIDRLKLSDLIRLCKEVATSKSPRSSNIKAIKRSLQDGYIMYYDAKISPDLFVRDPYTDQIMMASGATGKLEAANAASMQIFNQFKNAYFKSDLKYKDIVGYLDIDNKDGQFKFKIVKSESNSKGTFCFGTSTIKVSDLRNDIEQIDAGIIEQDVKYVKENFCNLYEILLRSVERVAFARPHQARVIAINTGNRK